MLKQTNQLVKQFKMVSELPNEEVAGKKFVLRAEGRPLGSHERNYNLPESDEVALVSLNDSLRPADIQIYLRNGQGVQRINPLNADYDPLHYTLLFPHGNSGWHAGMKQGNHRITSSEYYRHIFQVFKDKYNGILRCGKLMSEFACNSWFKTENQRLQYQRHHQNDLKADKYQGLFDALSAKEDLTTVGDRIVLTPSHTGSPRWYQSKFQVCQF